MTGFASLLDLKVAWRVLVRHPGLTLVAVVAVAFGIAVCAIGHAIVEQFVDPALPLPDAERVVVVREVAQSDGAADPRRAASLAPLWRDGLRTLDAVGGWRSVERNLVVDGRGEPIEVAEITPNAFELAPATPVLGRTLQATDALPGAAPVVVIDAGLWRTRFAGDPGVIGRSVGLGRAQHEVVGVVPDRHGFPVAQRLWIPRALDDFAATGDRGAIVFGRLAPGASLAAANAEIAALLARDGRAAQDARAEVVPYLDAMHVGAELDPAAMRAINVFLVLLLVLVCANVGMLTYARAAARASDVVVRSALGASPARILGQFFVEALVLAAIGSAVGLVAARFALDAWLVVAQGELGGRAPFWMRGGLPAETVVYALLLTLVVAAVSGLLPARRLSGRALPRGLAQVANAGSGLRFGGAWTAVIVVQVAVTVAFPACAYLVHDSVARLQSLDTGIRAERFATARLAFEPGETRDARDAATRAAALQRLEQRLEAHPGVAGATYAEFLPRTYHAQVGIEVERDASATRARHRVGANAVSPDFFATLGIERRAGSALAESDIGRDVVVVNESFVRDVLGGRHAVGMRIRTAANLERPAGPWLEIAGVVADAGAVAGDADPRDDAAIYRAESPARLGQAMIAVAVAGDPAAFEPVLRDVAASVDPALRVHDAMPLEAVGATLWLEFAFLFRALAAVSVIALVLALAGIHAVLAFTVARRTREIGVRVALGAPARRVVAAVFARPLRQVGAGLAAGSVLAGLLLHAVRGEVTGVGLAAFLGYVVVMALVCAAACFAPTRRALAVAPTVALRDEG